MENGEIAEYYVNAFRELAAVAGVRIEEMTSSEQFFDAIQLFPAERWYRRSMPILRARIRGKILLYEIYIGLFRGKSHRMVYKKQNVGGKLWITTVCVAKYKKV